MKKKKKKMKKEKKVGIKIILDDKYGDWSPRPRDSKTQKWWRKNKEENYEDIL